MIRLRRQELSEALSTQTRERIDRLTALLDAGEEPPAALLNAYRDPNLKAHLVSESHGKCIYCESKITHVYHGDVEHIKPKSVFRTLQLDPSNLGFACAICNGAKSDFWDDATPILNPYEDEPDEHLIALGDFLVRRPGQNRARLTIERLELNRPALLERRRERIELLQSLADQYMQENAGPVRDLIRAELCRQANADKEYALFVRMYLEAACNLVCTYA